MIRRIAILILCLLAWVLTWSQSTPSYSDLIQVMNKRTGAYNLVYRMDRMKDVIHDESPPDSLYFAFGCFDVEGGWYADHDTINIDTCYSSPDTLYLSYECDPIATSGIRVNGDTIVIDTCYGGYDTLYVSYECDPVLTSGLRVNGDTIVVDTCYISTADTNLWKYDGNVITPKVDTVSLGIDTIQSYDPNPELVEIYSKSYFNGMGLIRIRDDVSFGGSFLLFGNASDYYITNEYGYFGIYSIDSIAFDVNMVQVIHANSAFYPSNTISLGKSYKRWGYFYSTNITDDDTNLRLTVPIRSWDSLFVTKNDTVGKMAISDLPIPSGSNYWSKGDGYLYPSDGWDSTRVRQTWTDTISGFIDTTAVYNHTDTTYNLYVWLDGYDTTQGFDTAYIVTTPYRMVTIMTGEPEDYDWKLCDWLEIWLCCVSEGDTTCSESNHDAMVIDSIYDGSGTVEYWDLEDSRCEFDLYANFNCDGEFPYNVTAHITDTNWTYFDTYDTLHTHRPVVVHDRLKIDTIPTITTPPITILTDSSGIVVKYTFPGWGGYIDSIDVVDHPQFPVEYLRYQKDAVWDTVTRLVKPHGVMYGGYVTWIADTTFIAEPCLYFIYGDMYYIETSTTLLISSGDPVDPRIDIVVASNDTTISVIEGTPSPDPVKPTIDVMTQLELTQIYVPAGATSFDTIIDQEIIYNENIEWTGSVSGVTVDFANAVDPFVGDSCANVGTLTTGDKVTWTNGSTVLVSSFDIFIFCVKLKAAMSNKENLIVQFFDGAVAASNQFVTTINKGLLTWQVNSISLNEFIWYNTEYDKVVFTFTKTNPGSHTGLYMDYIKLEVGVPIPYFDNNIILTGDVSGVGTTGVPLNTTLATVNSNVGTFGDTDTTITITVDAKGRILSVVEHANTEEGDTTAHLIDGFGIEDMDYNQTADETVVVDTFEIVTHHHLDSTLMALPAGGDTCEFEMRVDTIINKSNHALHLTDSLYLDRNVTDPNSTGLWPFYGFLTLKKEGGTQRARVVMASMQEVSDTLLPVLPFDTANHITEAFGIIPFDYNMTSDATVAVDTSIIVTQNDLQEATTQWIFDPDASIVTKGTVITGTVDTLDEHDGNYWDIREVTGVPGYDIEVIFDSVNKEVNRFWFHGYYEGSASHSVAIQVWNYDDSSWETYYTLANRAFSEWIEFTLPDPDEHRRNDSVRARFYHIASGTVSHHLFIDYFVCVKQGFGSAAFTEDDPVFKDEVRDSVLSVMLGLYFTDPSPNADSTATGKASVMTAGENLIYGDVCYMKSDGKLWKADADSNIYMPGLYLCITKAGVSTGVPGNFLEDGYFRDDAVTWTLGGQDGVLFVGNTAGLMVQTAPSGSNDCVQPLGVAVTTHVIRFKPDLLIIELN